MCLEQPIYTLIEKSIRGHFTTIFNIQIHEWLQIDGQINTFQGSMNPASATYRYHGWHMNVYDAIDIRAGLVYRGVQGVAGLVDAENSAAGLYDITADVDFDERRSRHFGIQQTIRVD